MFLGKYIKDLWEEKGLVHRQLAAKLEIDTLEYSKIEHSEQKAMQVNVLKPDKILLTDMDRPPALCSAGQAYKIVNVEKEIGAAINLVEKNRILL